MARAREGYYSRRAHRSLTTLLRFKSCCGSNLVDAVFILAVIVLYAATHWLVWALGRLRSEP